MLATPSFAMDRLRIFMGRPQVKMHEGVKFHGAVEESDETLPPNLAPESVCYVCAPI